MKKLKIKKKVDLSQFAEKPVVDGKAFENMTRLIEAKRQTMDQYAESKATTDSIFKRLLDISRRQIPELANAIGQWIYKLPDGTNVEITTKLEASPAKKNTNKVHKWLEKMGAGSIIKKQIVLEFDRTEDGQKKFEHAEKALREADVVYSTKQAVNKATLEKHIRECREKGIEIDEKLLGVFDVYDTVIDGVKTPKKG